MVSGEIAFFLWEGLPITPALLRAPLCQKGVLFRGDPGV